MSLAQELDTRLRETLPRWSGHDLAWLQDYRQQTLAAFRETDPGSKPDKQWQLGTTLPRSLSAVRPGIDPAWLQHYRLPEAFCLVFVDGVLRPEYSVRDDLPDGVVLKALSEMRAEELTAHRARLTPPATDPLTRWNLIWLQDGVCLDIPERVCLQRPVQILCLASNVGELIPLRHLLTLGSQAEASVMETYAGLEGATGFTLTSTDIRLGTAALLDHHSLQRESTRARHCHSIQVESGPRARFRQHHVALGAARSLTTISNPLGLAAESQLNGLFHLAGSQQGEIHTRIDHAAPRGNSRQSYRGLATDQAKGVFDGIIQVQPQAGKISATMQNRNLLLSPAAEIDSRPQLEISADDVQCSHGVTVGQLDADAVFFLTARGLSEVEARTILGFAFANEIIQSVPPGHYRSLVQTAFLASLPQADIHQDWL